jgi:hypothetical protein
MVGPIINCGATTGYKKQPRAASFNWRMDEQWSVAPLFIHFLLIVEHDSTVHPFFSINSETGPIQS